MNDRGAGPKFSAHVLANAANDDVSFSESEYNIELEGMGAVRERLYHRAGSTIMNLKWCSIFAFAALAACSAPGTPELDAVDGFWTGTVPQGLLQLHILEINRELEGFGIVQATSGEIAVTMLGDRDGGGVNMTLTRSPGTTDYATFAGELDGDSLVGTWSSPPGTTSSTVRLGR